MMWVGSETWLVSRLLCLGLCLDGPDAGRKRGGCLEMKSAVWLAGLCICFVTITQKPLLGPARRLLVLEEEMYLQKKFCCNPFPLHHSSLGNRVWEAVSVFPDTARADVPGMRGTPAPGHRPGPGTEDNLRTVGVAPVTDGKCGAALP